MIKKRKTTERWIADIFQTPRLKRKADEADRRIDSSVGAQIRSASNKSPDTDWRTIARKETP